MLDLNTLTEDVQLQKIALAVRLAHSLKLTNEFYSQLLAATPSALFTDLQVFAVKQYLETKIAPLGAIAVVNALRKLLLSPDTGWSDLGLATISDASMGSPLSQDMKDELLSILDTEANNFINSLGSELNTLSA